MVQYISIFLSAISTIVTGVILYMIQQADKDRKEKRKRDTEAEERRKEEHEQAKQLLLGLGLTQISYLVREYIERGEVSMEEYNDLQTYLYKPYRALGGDGTAERLMETEMKNVKVIP